MTRRLGTTFARAGQRVSREAFPPGQVIAFAPSSPYARCMDIGGPVTFAEPDGATLERLRPDGREVVSGCSSFLAVPLTARDTVVGMLVFARDPGTPAFSRGEIATAARLGAQAGTAIVNALTLMRHRSIADALQRRPVCGTCITPVSPGPGRSLVRRRRRPAGSGEFRSEPKWLPIC